MLVSEQRAVASGLARAAAERALELVRPGMLIGLGTGSTARYFIEGLAQRVARGLRVTGVPSSRATADLAASLGIPITEEPRVPIDLAVDGADEIDPHLGLVKGGGGALTREKLVASAARAFVVVADESKLVDRLGRGPVPVEVLPFLWQQTAGHLEELGATCTLRRQAGAVYVTDNDNLILDLCFAEPLTHPARIAARLDRTPGVVEHGLFLGLATACFIGRPGGVRVLGSLDHLDASR